jgi:hypothetical protein
MEGRLFKRIELAANIAIIVTAVLLCVVLVRNYILPPAVVDPISSRGQLPMADELTGKRSSVEGLDWNANGKTMVLALSTTCHFCSESIPFYKRMIEKAGGNAVVAVFPQSVDEASAYLKTNGLTIATIKSATLDSIGVDGTPTVMMVDRQGNIVKSWRGKLDKNGEKDVLDAL